jgi:hypothetical protein
LLLLVAIPRLAFAEPKVAVAPLDDDDGKVADIVGDVVAERAKLVKPGRVESAMRSMGVGVLSAKTLKKLRAKLDVDVVIYGSVEKENGTKRVSLTFAGSNKSKPRLEVEAKNEKQLRKELAGKLAKRIATAMEGDEGSDEEDEEAAEREEAAQREAERKRQEDERRRAEERRKKEEEEAREREEAKRAERKRLEEDERKREAAERKRKPRGDEDEDEDDRSAQRKKRGDDRKQREDEDEDGDRKKKRVADSGEDEDEDEENRTRKRLGDEDEADEDDEDRPRKKRRQKRHALTQHALWLDGGAAFARRTLTYESTGMMRPPPVGVAVPSGRLEGELYPAAFSTLKGAVAGIGVSAVLGYTVGVGIDVPGTNVTSSVKNAHMAIGARYRFVFGAHSIAPGVSYWRRYFLADRSGLMNPDQLDMPDVDYKAIAPGVIAHIGVTPKVAAFGSLDVPLMLNSGPIQEPASYGSAKILAFDFRGGARITVAKHAALQVAAEFLQVGLAFTGQPGSKASARMVQSATDRSVGISATIGITY